MVELQTETSADYENYLYRDKQNNLLSKIGAFAAHVSDRLFYHGPIKFSGLEKLKLAEPNIIAPTHQSNADVSVMGWAAHKAHLIPPSFIARYSLIDDRPISGRLLPYTGAFFIARSKEDMPHIQRHVKEKFTSGHSVVMFPEGTRRLAGQDIKLERGLGILAVRLEIPISPVGIYGPTTSKRGKGSAVGVVVGDPIESGSNPIKFRNELTEVLADLRGQAKELIGE